MTTMDLSSIDLLVLPEKKVMTGWSTCSADYYTVCVFKRKVIGGCACGLGTLIGLYVLKWIG